ncbi:peptidoglycan editing factor PgeF [Pseudoalteromonas sp. Ld20]|uniref:peptidoglycan editing factor PgeF n=1 Tax=Pseudoalteromonas sp. Ld20 TaxID=649165 RepID=UPI0038655BA5
MLSPNWSAPTNVGALSTTRDGGLSRAPFSSLNLGLHVGDDRQVVLANRHLLDQLLPNPPIWLNQVHSAEVVVVDKHFDPLTVRDADALYTSLQNQPLAIMTADCLPILLTSSCGNEVAAIHGGWRGLNAGIMANTIAQFSASKNNIIAWLGPAIGALKFEVGSEVRAAFCEQSDAYEYAFKETNNGKYLADIYAIARIQLMQLGVNTISGGEYCTVSQPESFFSYRRDRQTGRMASLIWRK